MTSNRWISAWSSKIGAYHINEGLPCQDNSIVKVIEDSDFVVAAVSDGAGSCENSHIGSGFLIDNVIDKLITASINKDWIKSPSTINPESWREEVFNIFQDLKNGLRIKADEYSVVFSSLSATLIVAISNGEFIACANVGDGRATYRNSQGEWNAILTPTKGEEANQTLFITSDLWDTSIDSEFFGSTFFQDSISAFSLLTDGCERASFEILQYSEEEEKYYDPNKPYKPFFEPNYLALLELSKTTLSQDAINELWEKFLDNGTPKLSSETDDKTMVLSVYNLNTTDEAKV